MCDDRWWIETYHDTVQQVRRYLARRLPYDEIDDALADVYLTAWVRRDRFAACPIPVAWLLAVALNVTRHRGRARARSGRLAAIADAFETDPTADRVVDHQTAAGAADSLASLTPPDPMIVALRIVDEQDFRTIGEIVGLDPAAARQRYRRALQRVRRGASDD